jgi:hypothetical protein
MSDSTHHARKPWVIATAFMAILLIATLGTLLALRDQLAEKIRSETSALQEAQADLAKQVAAFEQRLSPIENASSVSPEEKASQQQQHDELSATIALLSSRMDTFEQRALNHAATPEAPTPVVVTPTASDAITPDAAAPAAPVAPTANVTATPHEALVLTVMSGQPFSTELAAWLREHPEHAPHVTALSLIAPTGMDSEANLMRDLRTALDELATPAGDTTLQEGTAGKINTHLSGLVSIRKSAPKDPYETLRRAALREDSAAVLAKVDALQSRDKKPLEAWLHKARMRQDALAALAALPSSTPATAE